MMIAVRDILAGLCGGLWMGVCISCRMLACCVRPRLRQEYKQLYSQKFHRDKDGITLALLWWLVLATALATATYRMLTWSWYTRLLLAIPSGFLIATIIVLVLAAFSRFWLWRIFLTGQEYAASEKKELEDQERRTQAAEDRSGRITTIKVGDCFISRGTFVRNIYGEVLERNESSVYARCYSEACPTGESGTVRLDAILDVISRSEFERRTGHRGQ